MKNSRTIFPLASFLAIVMFGAMPCFGEIPPLAGIVTHVFGTATLQHGADGEAQPIHFKDKVYIQDRIKTDEESVVRVLMGNKALVTIGEMSVLTITKEVNHATLDVESGSIGLSVARKRMNPGEYIEIRTPHAVAAIRGTKLVTEVANIHSSRFSVIEGKVDVAYHRADPGNKFPINRLQRFEFFKPEFQKRPRVQKLPPISQESLKSKPRMKAPRLSEVVTGPAESDVADKQMSKAMKLAKQLAPESPVTHAQQQVASRGNSDSSSAASSSTQSSASGEGVGMASPPTASTDSTSTTTSSSSAPASVASAPAPTTSAPAPAVSASAPVVSAPAPVASAPAPTISAPAVSAPAPAVSAPAPAVSAPAPVVRAPVVVAPAPVVRAPVVVAPALVVRAPVVVAPAPKVYFDVKKIQRDLRKQLKKLNKERHRGRGKRDKDHRDKNDD